MELKNVNVSKLMQLKKYLWPKQRQSHLQALYGEPLILLPRGAGQRSSHTAPHLSVTCQRVSFKEMTQSEIYFWRFWKTPPQTHSLFHAGDDESQVCAHLLLVCVFLLDALLKTEKARYKTSSFVCLYSCKRLYI